MNEAATFKIACPNCQGHIEFPKEMHGQTIPCPHCDLTAVLKVAGYVEPALAKEAYSQNSLAQHIPENFYGSQMNLNKQVIKEIEKARAGRGLIIWGSFMMVASVGGCATGGAAGAFVGFLLFFGGLGVFVIGRLRQN